MENKKKELLFSITRKDFEIQTFCAGGKGGQKQNKTASGVRIIHKDSGARGESREFRERPQNQKAAFDRLVKSKKFQAWLTVETAKAMTGKSIDQIVEEMMDESYLQVEGKNNGKWEVLPNCDEKH